jgi:hypothetical protein
VFVISFKRKIVINKKWHLSWKWLCIFFVKKRHLKKIGNFIGFLNWRMPKTHVPPEQQHWNIDFFVQV